MSRFGDSHGYVAQPGYCPNGSSLALASWKHAPRLIDFVGLDFVIDSVHVLDGGHRLAIVFCEITSCQMLHAQTKINVSSLRELREAIQRDNQTIASSSHRAANIFRRCSAQQATVSFDNKIL